MQTNCLDAIQSMKALVQERDELLAEVNTWRNASGLAERQPKDVDMNSEKLGSLEKAIHMNPSDSSPGCTSQSPDSELGPKNVEDGKQAGFATQPQCSPLTTFIAATQGAHNDMSNPFPLSTGFHEDLSLGTMSLPLNADSHSVFPHNPQLGPNTLLLDAPGIRGGGEDSAMAIKQPQCDITGSDKPELQIGHQLAYTIHDELAAQRSLLDGEGLMTTEGCDLEFPVSMATPIDFNTELVLQRNPSWAF
ncbi:hypothetical protein EDB81DRAFT_137300 [Dactylonectria macrodidyma]|uniref:Uncharacterized protein n=1 Tax=Dactylonectria macrodidyma TaxID=307937 RepID=A0A9P9IUG4_9HYPO|nr:hypothetical protein EDB81DRAFT_137300 [Dactylonectria macrodidyma]